MNKVLLAAALALLAVDAAAFLLLITYILKIVCIGFAAIGLAVA